MTTCTDHQLFIFREKLWIFLSVLEVGNLSLFTTFKKQFGLGRWKKGPPRIEHSIHSNIPRLNISLLQFREFPLHTMCAQWWPLIRSRGIQDVQMCRTAAYSWRFIMIHIHSYHIHIQIHQHLKALCLMLCMQFYPLDLNQTKGSGKSWRCPYLSDIASTFSISRHCSPWILVLHVGLLITRFEVLCHFVRNFSQRTTWRPGHASAIGTIVYRRLQGTSHWWRRGRICRKSNALLFCCRIFGHFQKYENRLISLFLWLGFQAISSTELSWNKHK